MGSSNILAYLGQLLNGQQACYRMKLMFVGQENVGYLESHDTVATPHHELTLGVSRCTAKLRF
jgi:hypothetical protein